MRYSRSIATLYCGKYKYIIRFMYFSATNLSLHHSSSVLNTTFELTHNFGYISTLEDYKHYPSVTTRRWEHTVFTDRLVERL